MFQPIFDKKYERSLWTVILGLFMGLFIISLIFWNRLIRERLPKQIVGEPYTALFFIVLVMFLYFLFLFISYTYKIQKKLRGITKKNVYVAKVHKYLKDKPTLIDICQFIINYVLYAPMFLWRFIYFNSSPKHNLYLVNFFYRLGIFIYSYFFPPESNILFRQRVTLITFVYLPRILTFSVFFYEILVMRKLEYFYHCLIILLIPLIFLSLRRILLDISHFELEKLQQGYIKIISRQKVCELTDRENFTVKKLHADMPDNIYQHAIDNFLYFYEILLIAVNSFKLSEKYDSIVSLLTYFLLTLGFLTWLLILLEII